MKPLTQSLSVHPISEALIRDCLEASPTSTRDQIIAALEEENARTTYWLNDIFQVALTEDGGWLHINIRRRDGHPIKRDWRVFQDIKNQLVGPEREAVELYPAESRLVDTSNKYHLWVHPDPSWRFPFGYPQRDVLDAPGESPGARQRPRKAGGGG
jgi:hypothetical protein